MASRQVFYEILLRLEIIVLPEVVQILIKDDDKRQMVTVARSRPKSQPAMVATTQPILGIAEDLCMDQPTLLTLMNEGTGLRRK